MKKQGSTASGKNSEKAKAAKASSFEHSRAGSIKKGKAATY